MHIAFWETRYFCATKIGTLCDKQEWWSFLFVFPSLSEFLGTFLSVISEHRAPAPTSHGVKKDDSCSRNKTTPAPQVHHRNQIMSLMTSTMAQKSKKKHRKQCSTKLCPKRIHADRVWLILPYHSNDPFSLAYPKSQYSLPNQMTARDKRTKTRYTSSVLSKLNGNHSIFARGNSARG